VIFAFIDVETTGLDWNKHSIVQLGYVVSDERGNILADGDFLVYPGDEFIVSKDALSVNNVNVREALEQGKSAKEVYEFFKQFKESPNHGIVFSGWNVCFDWLFVKTWFERNGLDFFDVFAKSMVDVKSLYISRYKRIDNLKNAARRLNINTPISNWHDAGFDAFVTYLIWKRLEGL